MPESFDVAASSAVIWAAVATPFCALDASWMSSVPSVWLLAWLATLVLIGPISVPASSTIKSPVDLK